MKYTVTITSPLNDVPGQRVSPPRLLEIKCWCDSTLQYPSTYKWRFKYVNNILQYHQTWFFGSIEDQTLFKLTWV